MSQNKLKCYDLLIFDNFSFSFSLENNTDIKLSHLHAHTFTGGRMFVLGTEELKSAERILKELFPESLKVKLTF